ncbi:hypothetical protein POVCU2_0048450 [Plasmodium ovale curtisi]|uniref:Uncharacterized protein n=1 Tax=Plasmodium ovale curtisi TaxID=864141 RepID=A0A1A8X276_PLAOA|nr:hypothetical protein POVCU2_0048450 [Plasmodium ovale curtisi]SBS98272.1 hypothetical protein POVCU1_044850 [Plasmodium ovale curtisi]
MENKERKKKKKKNRKKKWRNGETWKSGKVETRSDSGKKEKAENEERTSYGKAAKTCKRSKKLTTKFIPPFHSNITH